MQLASGPSRSPDHLAHVTAGTPRRAVAHHEAAFAKALEDFGEPLGRDPELVGDPLDADCGVALVLGDVLHRQSP